ncbi:LytR C-terminal domain-containing protein [Actinoplanes sp. NPDC051494]|uniref:LytR C-terminal domain-containing protein n=1 Tax=Actinoplanes sp. NPDC051494 TaxID=3363907 RepID=UPI003787F05C
MSFTRVRAFIVLGVLTITALVVVIVAVVKDTQGGPVADRCKGLVVVNATLPKSTEEVTVKVYNGTKQVGLGSAVTTHFSNRGFKTEKPEEAKKAVKDVAVLRYGPEGLSATWLIQAFFLNQATPEYNPKRKGATVDVIVGNGYQQLATPTEVNQSLSTLDQELPPGSCAAPRAEAAAVAP